MYIHLIRIPIKKLLKILARALLGLGILLLFTYAVLYVLCHEPRPELEASFEADMLANKMLKAVGNEAYKNTRYLEWSFRNGAHQFLWDKTKGVAQVTWSDKKVVLDLNDTAKSMAYQNTGLVRGDRAEKLIKKATALFNNDSFWLVAPFKVFDPGTQRGVVLMEDGSRGLLVTYSSGGDTPGDTYLWKLRQDGFPESYQMWVSIIPIGGVEASWDDWQVVDSGAFLPKSHELGPITLDMGAVKGYN
ncbi:hypothetical protein [Spongiimicrobium sp. 2-473A-2-J]|uniref:hypothetical protein n=1 Tax=Eudoraea algarum TaxID=3417568 RepID=UPI003D36E281